MTPEELKVVKMIRKRRRKNPLFRVVVASKSGANAKGRGADRSVLLCTKDDGTWSHYYKVWGENNEVRAREIISKSLEV